MLPRPPALLMLLLTLFAACPHSAHAERDRREVAERSERAAAREQRDRLKTEKRERSARDQARTERNSRRDSRSPRNESDLQHLQSTSGSDAAKTDDSKSGEAHADALKSSEDSATSPGSNISGSGTAGPSSSGSSTSGSSTSGSNSSGSNVSGSSDSSGSGSGGSDDSGEDHSGSGSDDDFSEGMTSGRGVPIATEQDARGRERRVGEILVVDVTSAAPTARAAGYEVIEERPLANFGEVLVRVRIRAGEDAEVTLATLRALLPAATLAVNHVFRPSSDAATAAVLQQHTLSARTSATIGIIDTGAFERSAALHAAIERTAAFAGSPYTPRNHGTVVCEIAAGSGARLSVADVFGVDANARLIASADAIASSLNWLVGHAAGVINISVAGPYNPILEHIIARTVASGAIIVAAAGNDGPAAEPVYPAAYPGVIAVTAVDERGQVYRRANRGDYVMFAARGVHVPVKDSQQASGEVSGTSFAAPVVAAELARLRMRAPAAPPERVIDELKRSVVDLGARGRDPVYGWGSVGDVRVVPSP